jgi:hypothetical protein
MTNALGRHRLRAGSAVGIDRHDLIGAIQSELGMDATRQPAREPNPREFRGTGVVVRNDGDRISGNSRTLPNRQHTGRQLT